MQQRLFDIGWSDENECQACQQEKHRLYHCPAWHEVRREIPQTFRTWEQKAKTSKKEWKWQRGVVAHPNSDSPWNRGQSSMTSGSPRSTKAGVCQLRASRVMIPLTAPLLGTAGKWRACGWVVVRLHYDEEEGPLHGMHGTMEAAFEVQRTIKRAELTAIFCLLKTVIGPIKVHVDNKGVICGLWRGER